MYPEMYQHYVPLPQKPDYPDWQGRRAIKSIFLAISGALWLGALALPAYTDESPGIAALLMGWMLLFDGDTFGLVAWFANIPFITAVFMFIFGRRTGVIRTSMILAVVAGVFSLGAFTVSEIPSYGGTSHVSPDFGCYTWVISLLILMTGTIVYYTQLVAVVNRRQ